MHSYAQIGTDNRRGKIKRESACEGVARVLSLARYGRYAGRVKLGAQFPQNFVTSLAPAKFIQYLFEAIFRAKSARHGSPRRDATRCDVPAFLPLPSPPPCSTRRENRLIVNLNLSNREFKSGRVIDRVFQFFFRRCHLSRRIKRPFITRGLMKDSPSRRAMCICVYVCVFVYTILCCRRIISGMIMSFL